MMRIDGALQPCNNVIGGDTMAECPYQTHVHPGAVHHPAGDAAEDVRSGGALLLLGSTCFPETLLKSPKGELLIDEDHMAGL